MKAQAWNRVVVIAVVLFCFVPRVGAAACVGDCNGNGFVTVDEIVQGVNITLGVSPVSLCPAFDSNSDEEVTVNEIVQGVNNALVGCPMEPTPTNTAPLPTPTPAASPAINVGSASGSAGGTVPIAVSLLNGGGMIVATSNDIVFNSTQVGVALNGTTPDCTIDPRIGAGSAANKSLLLSVTTIAGGMGRLTVGVINFQNANVISDGVLFTCNFTIAPAATPGDKILANTPGASDADGEELVVGGTNGNISVGP